MQHPRRVFVLVGAMLAAVTGCTSSGPGDKPTSTPHADSPAPSSAGVIDPYFQNPVPIGVKYDQPGFSVDAGGRFAGFDIDLATYLATRVGFQPGSYEQVGDLDRADVLGGRVKLVVATYSITQAREQGTDGHAPVDFAGPYMQTPDALLVKQGSPWAHADPDLTNVRVCALPGSTTEPGAVPLPPGVIMITSAKSYGECVNDVETGVADAVFTDQLVLDGYAADTVDYPGLAVEPTQYGGMNQYGIALPHGQAVACQSLIPVLQSFINDRKWAEYFSIEFPTVVAADPQWQQNFQPDPTSIPQTSYCA